MKGYCAKIGREDIGFLVAGASKGRWWSVILGFGDAYLLRNELSDWCLADAQASTSPTFGPLFDDTAAWLKNDKITANLAFVLAFCKSWWTPEMIFAQGTGPWQARLPMSKKLAGYRADEYSVRVVTMRWKLLVILSLLLFTLLFKCLFRIMSRDV